MNVQLNKWFRTDAFEAVNLAGFDHENVPSPTVELSTVDDPSPAPGLYELDFIVGMSMWGWAGAGRTTEQEHGHVGVALLRPHELARAANKRQFVISNGMHVRDLRAIL